MKIAVIGAGFFGISCALLLSKKHDVDLIEKEGKILNGASFANQFRFHSGYHYPRSQKTVNEIKINKVKFIKSFGNTVSDKTTNYYLIAKDSKVSFKKYESFLKKNKLSFTDVNIESNSNRIEKCILTKEKNLNYKKIKKDLLDKIKKSKVKVKLNRELLKTDLLNYDKIILTTYANNNLILKELKIKKLLNFQFELVEKILIKLPKKYLNKSYIVIDGKYVCVDPYLGTNYHLLSDVKLSKLEKNIGKFPIFKNKNKVYLNKGIIKDIKISRFKKIINRSSLYLPFLKKSKYVGSMFVVRAVKINKKSTDERTSSIYHHTKNIFSVLSGKWSSCIHVAQAISKKLQ